jgi:hypothetical protein
MMHVDERGVPAARYLAAVPIAQQHRATDGRRNSLRRALRMAPGGRLALAREWPTHVGFVTRAWRPHVGFVTKAWMAHVDFVAANAITAAADAGSFLLSRTSSARPRLRAAPLDLLRIAARHFRNFRRDLQCLTETRLRSSCASFTNRQRNLVAGSPVVGGSAEHVPRHQQQRRVVIERSARIAAQLGLGFAKARQHLRRDFEA